MFGIKLPGFLNPLTPFKQALAVTGTLVANAKEIASAPVDIAKHQVGFAKDVLTLDFKGAARHQLAILAEPASTAKNLAGNQLNLGKELLENLV